MTRPFVISAVFACIILGPPPAASALESDAEIARLEAAIAAHPHDSDLLWALAIALARQGHHEQAAETFEAFEARWPRRHPRVALQLGISLFEAGRDTEAIAALDRAIEADPRAGAAHLYRGLALRRLGRTQESHRSLRAAAALSPELAPEALLARALDHLGLGEDAEAKRLLEETIDRDPNGETAMRAQLLLVENEENPILRPFRSGLVALSAYGGVDYDSNVTLGSGDDALGLPPGEDDFRFVWGSGITLRPLRGERGGLRFDYQYQQAAHLDRTDFDLQGHGLAASGLLRAGERASLRLDGGASTYRRNGEPYLRSAAIQPNLLVSLGDRIGVTRFFGDVRWFDYDEEPPFESMERDAIVYGGGVEHYVSVPERRGLWGSIGARFHRADTRGGTDVLGFESAYDHDRWEGQLNVHVPLAWKVAADARFAVGHARYRNPNVFDFLFSFDTDERRDLYGELGVKLTRPIQRFVRLEVAWRGIRRVSNVGLYDYDRHVVGLYLRAFTN